jgi:hypothetical protein
MDDADKPESDAAEQTPPKIKAEDNPWYLLATLYGVPERGDQELKDKNRRAWNRYFAANLDAKNAHAVRRREAASCGRADLFSTERIAGGRSGL